VFESSISGEYAYLCGSLHPLPGDYVIVETSAGKLKVVRCVRLGDSDPRATKPLHATLTLQADHAPSL
jgi:hypothetical protein